MTAAPPCCCKNPTPSRENAMVGTTTKQKLCFSKAPSRAKSYPRNISLRSIAPGFVPHPLFSRREFRFARSADRALPVIRKILKRRSRRYSVFRIARFRVVDISARLTFVFFHRYSPFVFPSIPLSKAHGGCSIRMRRAAFRLQKVQTWRKALRSDANPSSGIPDLSQG